MITQARLQEVFEYRCDGVLVRRLPGRGNAVGRVAGSKAASYINMMVDGERHLAHRMVFLYHHGHLPPQVDHINGDKCDNRIENLRAADAVKNAYNRPVNANSGTGVKNVCLTRCGTYAVRLSVDGRNTRFGAYATLAEAERVAAAARERFHSEFANHGTFTSGGTFAL